MKIFKEKYYLIISLVVTGLLIVISGLMILFLYRTIAKSFNIDESSINSQIIKFDLESYEKIKSKLPSSVSQVIMDTNNNVNTNASNQ